SPGDFTSLDLAFNCIGTAGAVALRHALTTACTSMTFLELRGNTDTDTDTDNDRSADNIISNSQTKTSNNGIKKDNVQSNKSHVNSTDINNGGDPVGHRPVFSFPPPALQLLLQEIEDVCAERRRRLRERQQLEVRRRTSIAVAALRAAPAFSSATLVRASTATARQPVSNHCHQRPGTSGETTARAPAGSSSDDESLQRLPGCDNSAAKPRPLEGALPLRGYYLSPLLDSSFDLLMLREPVCDPADLSLYVNRARNMLEQRRAFRENQQEDGKIFHGRCDGGDGDDSGVGVGRSGVGNSRGDGAG
ncbi:unnamed protein product, partial [Hapterophycus canaliculatus]